MGSIPILFRQTVKLEPTEEEVDNDVVEEGLVVEKEVIVSVNGNRRTARWRKLAVLFIELEKSIDCYQMLIKTKKEVLESQVLNLGPKSASQ